MKYDYMVYIGRFEPPHLAHIHVIKEALKQATNVIVLAGSANQPRTIKNPFTWQEREEMINASLPEHLSSRVFVRPLYDKTYNDQAWTRQVQDIVDTYARPPIPPRIDLTDKSRDDLGNPINKLKIGITGYSKDESSYYLSLFPQWDLVEVNNMEIMNATDIRAALFTSEDGDDFDLKIGRNLPAGIHDWLRAFMMRPEYEQLVAEYKFIEKYKKAWESAPYAPTFVTVDSVVIQSGHVLLVRRRAEPGKGLWAIPGGFVGQGERITNAAIRELREETKLKVPAPVLRGSIKSVEVFDHPERSLRGRTITHAHLIELPAGELPKVKGSDDADKARWVPLSAFAKMEDQMFEDHFHIINHFLGEV